MKITYAIILLIASTSVMAGPFDKKPAAAAEPAPIQEVVPATPKPVASAPTATAKPVAAPVAKPAPVVVVKPVAKPAPVVVVKPVVAPVPAVAQAPKPAATASAPTPTPAKPKQAIIFTPAGGGGNVSFTQSHQNQSTADARYESAAKSCDENIIIGLVCRERVRYQICENEWNDGSKPGASKCVQSNTKPTN